MVTPLAPMCVRHGRKNVGKRLLDLVATLVSLPADLISSRRLEHTILGEKTHQALEIVPIPGIDMADEKLVQIRVDACHSASFCDRLDVRTYDHRVTSRELEQYFEGRPESARIFDILANRIEKLGGAEITVASQISFGRRRKFAWFWLYNVTKKNPNGVPQLMLALDHERPSEHTRLVTQAGNQRWNHQIMVRSDDDARSGWLGELLTLAYEYGGD